MKFALETWEHDGTKYAKIRILDDAGKCLGATGIDFDKIGDDKAVQAVKDALEIQAKKSIVPPITIREI